jgi:hypothetical protein
VWASELSTLEHSIEVGDVGNPGDEGYEHIGVVSGTEVSRDSVRLSWETGTYRVWVAAGPSASHELPSLDRVRPFVQATLAEA